MTREQATEVPTFSDWLAGRLGTRDWVMEPRLTKELRAKGYTLALSPKRYDALEKEWETERYGAPLRSLEKAAPGLLSALIRMVEWAESGADPSPKALAAAHAAIAKARGESV
jgi:hypothetical protein